MWVFTSIGSLNGIFFCVFVVFRVFLGFCVVLDYVEIMLKFVERMFLKVGNTQEIVGFLEGNMGNGKLIEFLGEKQVTFILSLILFLRSYWLLCRPK